MKPTCGVGVAAVAMAMAMGLFGGSAFARQSRQDPDVMSAMLTEVRGLRVAIEQLAATGPRVQLAMGRLQMQEQRIDALGKRHIEVRDRRMETEGELVRAKQMMGANENALRTSTNPTARAQAEAEAEHVRNHGRRPDREGPASADRRGDDRTGRQRRAGAMVRDQPAARRARSRAQSEIGPTSIVLTLVSL